MHYRGAEDGADTGKPDHSVSVRHTDFQFKIRFSGKAKVIYDLISNPCMAKMATPPGIFMKSGSCQIKYAIAIAF